LTLPKAPTLKTLFFLMQSKLFLYNFIKYPVSQISLILCALGV
jgi:hypothetical protein